MNSHKISRLQFTTLYNLPNFKTCQTPMFAATQRPPIGDPRKCTAKKEGSPDNTSQYCSSKVIALPCCKQSTEDKGGKN
ncbi:hypothetical protein IW262DRAFT_1409765 [Armillaria fumosa]|nr:hypothetical protein IW262DRAFT_1409765 [Armillaria fumosa]